MQERQLRWMQRLLLIAITRLSWQLGPFDICMSRSVYVV